MSNVNTLHKRNREVEAIMQSIIEELSEVLRIQHKILPVGTHDLINELYDYSLEKKELEISLRRSLED